MVPWSALVLPVLVSAALVFVASSVVHMVLKLHNPDYKKLPNEDEVRAAIRRGSPPRGQYVIPHCVDGKAAELPEMQKKFEEGPVGILYVGRNGPIQLGPFLGKWVAYTVALGAVCAVLARTTLHSGDSFAEVFHTVALAAWLGYSWQGPSDSIWKHKPWAITFRSMLDGLVYALITAATFAWLWPR